MHQVCGLKHVLVQIHLNLMAAVTWWNMRYHSSSLTYSIQKQKNKKQLEMF